MVIPQLQNALGKLFGYQVTAEAVVQPSDEVGIGGTPIFSGFLRDLGEYNPELTGLAAIDVYEKMRRSDATVDAVILAVTLPITSAEWIVAEPQDATPVEKEIADFVRENMFEHIGFRKMLRNALLMLPFGCSAHEDVFEYINGKLCLKKCADRLPRTFYRFDTADNGGTLRALIQLGYGGETYKEVAIPADKLALFVHRQEGSNFYGRSILRAAYRNWFAKERLERIDCMAIEKNASGVPVVIGAPNAKKEDADKARTWVPQVATHQKLGVYLPNGYTFDVKGVTGQVRPAKDAIHYHNVQITIASLAQFLMLGEQKGARALGDTLSDFFAMSLQSTADDIAEVLNGSTVKRLVAYNYGDPKDGKFRAPMVKVQKILSLNFETIATALAQLAKNDVDLIRADGKLEEHLRNMMGLPQADEATTRVKVPPTPVPAPAAPAQPGKQQLSDSSGLKLRRQPRGVENSLALSDIVRTLDSGRDRCAALLRAARPALQAEVLHNLAKAKPGKLHRVSIASDASLIAKIRGVLDEVAQFGKEQVGQEKTRQSHGAAPATAQAIRASSSIDSSRDPVGLYAETEVSDFLNQLQARGARIVSGLRRDGVRDGELLTKAGASLDDQADGWIDGLASEGSNSAFATGRDDGYAAHKDEIASVQYSALLDDGTCDACGSADGEEGETPDDITPVPNPDCGGGDKCRCVHVYVFADEERAA